jgi:hypothetical protein
VVVKYIGNGIFTFSVRRRTKPLTDQSKNVGGTTKVHSDREGVMAPHMGEVVDWWSFFRYFTSKRLNPTYYTPIVAVSAKDVQLWISSIHLIPWGNYPPNPFICGMSAQKKRIIMLDDSKCVSRQDTQYMCNRKSRDGII